MRFFKWLHSLFFRHSQKKDVYPHFEKHRESKELPIHFHRLSNQGNAYYINYKVPYTIDGTLKKQTIDRVFDFAYKMAFTAEGAHRSTRSGGEHSRRNGEIFANTFQGKIAECAACNFFYKYDNSVTPDFSVFKLGKWDTVDLSVAGREIAIKSTKHFGQLLLLETKDWDRHGRYIPNKGKNVSSYDCMMLIRMKPSCEDILKHERLLYSDFIEREQLYNLIIKEAWSYNYVGFITHNDLCDIIRQQYILPKRGLLNGSTPMDAENYYVQAGDMRNISTYEDVFLTT